MTNGNGNRRCDNLLATLPLFEIAVVLLCLDYVGRMKLDRAKQRMKELEEALQSFYATNPFKFSGKADLQAGKVVYTMDSVKDAPDEASLIAREIIQNLRSALDHLAYQLFLRGGGTGAGKNIYFSIG